MGYKRYSSVIPRVHAEKIYLVGGLQHETLRKCGKMDYIMMEMRSTKITILSVCGGSRAQSGKLTPEGIT